MASSISIIIPGPERVAAASPRADSRARNDVRAFAASRPSANETARAHGAPTSQPAIDLGRSPSNTFGKPHGSLPFLAQQIAQGGMESAEPGDAVAPTIRFSALRAYGMANDSNVEFLSPTPVYDLHV